MLPSNLPATAKAVFGYLCNALLILLVLIAVLWLWHCAPVWLQSADEARMKMQVLQEEISSLEMKISEAEVVPEPRLWQLWKWPAYWAQERLKNELSEASEKLALLGRNLPAQMLLIVHTHHRVLVGTLFTVLLLPFLWRTAAYWLLMPLLGRALPPSRLIDVGCAGSVRLERSGKPLPVILSDDEVLYVQQGRITQRSGVDIRDQLCWDKTAPLISSAAHLWWIIALTKETGLPCGEVTLSTGDEDSYVAEVRIEGHPGLVIRPAQIVAVSSGVRIHTKWRWGMHHWLNGQLRYVLFSGTGRVWVKAQGGVATGGDTQRPSRLEHPLVIAYDGRAQVAATRTQSFFAYVFGSSELCDLEIAHGYLHLHQQTVPKNFSHALQNSFTFVLQSIGKLAGL